MMIRFRNPEEERYYKSRKRLTVFIISLLVGYSTIVGRALHLMLKDNEQLEEMAMSQYRAAIQNETIRSRILDTNGYELAISIPTWSLYADPKIIEDPKQAARLLAPLLNISQEKITHNLAGKKRFVWLKRRVNARTMEKIRGLGLKGVDAFKENARFYPHGDLAGSVLGAVGIDAQALGGIELAYDSYLMIPPKEAVYMRDARGQLVYSPQPSQNFFGKGDVTLTIDKNIQFFAEQFLRSAVKKYNAEAGVVIVMDPATGEILAMASAPFFDPNHFKKASWGAWRNRAVTDVYEPGSTFKMIIAASALEDRKISLKEKFNCEGGTLTLPDGNTVHDHKGYGMLDLAGILKVSSNIGTFKISQRLNKKKLAMHIRDFGFGVKTGIDFPGESSGIMHDLTKLRPIEQTTIAFGYGIGATPIQTLSAYAAVANAGVRMKPHLVKKILSREGEISREIFPQALSRPISPETSKILTKLLQGVVEEGGTATLAAVNAYTVAGKTGTAKKVDPERRGYLEGQYIASFVGFAPAENPRLAAIVLIDNPKGQFYGGEVAAPVFQEVIHHSLHYLGVPSAGASSSMTVAKSVTAPMPQRTCAKETGLCFEPMTREGPFYRIPDFYGSSMREVLKSAALFPVAVEFQGRGEATRQSPPAGTLVSSGSKIYVEFSPLY